MTGSVGLVMLAGLVACGSDPEPAAEQPVFVAPTTTIVATTVVTTTTSPSTPPEHLTSCVENAKFQAFTGNEFWTSMWAEAGMTDGGMRAVCEFLAQDDPDVLARVHRDWTALQAASGTTTATFGTTVETDAASAPDGADPSLVAACVDWVEYNRLVGDQRALDLWENLGGSRAALIDVCTGIARANPAEATAMRDEMAGVDNP